MSVQENEKKNDFSNFFFAAENNEKNIYIYNEKKKKKKFGAEIWKFGNLLLPNLYCEGEIVLQETGEKVVGLY